MRNNSSISIARALLLILPMLILLTACSPQQRFQQQVEKAVSESFTYSTYESNGFSAKYPYWPEAANTSDDVEVSVSRGYCSVAINQERLTASQWYGAMVDAIRNSPGSRMISEESDAHRLEYSTLYQNITLLNEARVYGCNGYGYVVLVFCIEQAEAYARDVYDTVFGSVSCEDDGSGSLQPAPVAPAEAASALEDIKYESFRKDDFSVQHPDWAEMSDTSPERVLGVSAGVCSVVVNEYNALPEDLAQWIRKAVTEKDEDDLLSYSEDDDEYSIDYRFSADGYDLVARTKMLYCNYVTYSAIVVCLDNATMPGMSAMTGKVLSSAHCAKEYAIPTPAVIEQRKEEIREEEPDVVEEIEDSIVKTHAGEEFGIDEEMVVYFINNNAFFTKVMKDFPSSDLRIEDKENSRTLELKVDVDTDTGKITSLEDGSHSSPDVTLIIPLRDALNIFSNAQNINPITLLSFAVNVRTEPAGIKDQVIQDVLKGKYK